MATIKPLFSNDITNTQSSLNQLIDFIQGDVSSSAGNPTRRKYQVYVTGATDTPGVTSSLYHTIYDQDYNLQTSNEMFDITVGIFSGSDTVTNSSTGLTTNGKLTFDQNSLMMREKINNYRQYAQLLLGDAEGQFTAPFTNPGTTDYIDHAMFLSFKRLFVRDGIKRETFAMKFYQTASQAGPSLEGLDPVGQSNVFRLTLSGSKIFTDVGSTLSISRSKVAGDVGSVVDSGVTNRKVGLLFYDMGIAVFDLDKITSASQYMSGTIDAVTASNVYGESVAAGKTVLGDKTNKYTNGFAKFIPDFLVSGSIDDILEHISSVRFGTGTSAVGMTFQNQTLLNSTLIFCKANATEFNYSSNPTFTDSTGRIVTIDQNAIAQRSIVFVTTVGLYDANSQLMATAKMSRPIEKSFQKDLVFRIRLDF